MTDAADSGASMTKDTTVTQVTIETVETLSEDEGHKVKENIFY